MKLADLVKRLTEEPGTARAGLAPEERALAAVFEPSMQALEQQRPAAAALLSLCAFFAPDGIPLDLIRKGGDKLPEALRTAGGDPEQFNDIVAALVRSSLAKRDGDLLFVHRLIQPLARERLGKESRKLLAGCAAELLSEALPAFPHSAFDAATAAVYDRLAAHAIGAAEHAAAAGVQLEGASRLFDRVGIYRYLRADYAVAEELFGRAVEIAELAFGAEDPNVAICLNNLAQLLKKKNRLAEAEPLMRRVLEIDEKAYGPDNPEVATDLNNLARLLHDTNRLDEAEPLLRRALEIDERALGPEHPNVAIRLSNLALLLKSKGRFDEAEPLMRRVLEIDERAFDPHHPEVATDLNNLASILRATDRIEEAEPLLRRALQIDERSLGPDHPNVARDLNNLAQLLQSKHLPDQAEPLLRRALEIDERAFGLDHPRVATCLNNLAGLLEETDRGDEAALLRRRAKEIENRS